MFIHIFQKLFKEFNEIFAREDNYVNNGDGFPRKVLLVCGGGVSVGDTNS